MTPAQQIFSIAIEGLAPGAVLFFGYDGTCIVNFENREIEFGATEYRYGFDTDKIRQRIYG